jgi:hypothetical protein
VLAAIGNIFDIEEKPGSGRDIKPSGECQLSPLFETFTPWAFLRHDLASLAISLFNCLWLQTVNFTIGHENK